jgi:peptidoglycan-associated lipoprotein
MSSLRLAILPAVLLAACASTPPPAQPTPAQQVAQPAPPPPPPPAQPAPTPPPQPASLSPASIYFEYDSAELSSDARSALQSLYDVVKDRPLVLVRVEGNCDERGTAEYNLALGQRRADAAKKYLVNLGLAGARVTSVSNGKEKPRAHGSDESSWQENRRDDVTPSQR